MSLNKEKILKLKEELLMGFNSNLSNDQSFSLKISSCDIDPKTKELFILVYSILSTQHNQNITLVNKMFINTIDVLVEILYENKTNTEQKISDITNIVQNSLNKEDQNNKKWYHDYKLILTGGGAFLVVVAFLTMLFSLDPEATTSAIGVFKDLFIQVTVPGG